jgi:hypothetical protein
MKLNWWKVHGKRMMQYEMHAYECIQYDACSMLILGISHDMLGFNCGWVPSMVGLLRILWGKMVKVWYLGLLAHQHSQKPNTLKASNGC